MNDARQRLLGCVLSLLSSMSFAIQGLFFKFIQSMDSLEIVFARMTFTVMVLVPYFLITRRNVMAAEGNLKWVTVAGLAVVVRIGSQYMAMRLMPYADVSAILFSGFVFVLFFAWIFLKESCGVFEITMTFITTIGIILVAHPEALVALFIGGLGHSDEVNDLFISRLAGSGLALLSCLCSVVIYLSVRKCRSVHYSVTVFHSSVWGVIISAAMTSSCGRWSLPQGWSEWAYVCGVALSGSLSTVLVFQALRLEGAGIVSMVRTSEIAVSYVLQRIFLNQSPNMYAAIGATIISMTSVSCGLRAWLNAQKNSSEYSLHKKFKDCC